MDTVNLVVLVFSLGYVSAIRQCDPTTGRCFWLIPETHDWASARAACQQDGNGDLAVIETLQLYNFVIDNLNVSDQTIWIGLDSRDSERVFRWLSRAPLYYSSWKPNEPDSQVDRCVHLAGELGMEASECNFLTDQVLCSTTAPNCTEAKDGCSSFNYTRTVILTEYHTPANFSVAKATCEAEGKRLLTVRDPNKDQALNRLHNTDFIWLDLTDLEVESVFRWPDGSIATWSQWYLGQPNGRRTENCVARHSDGKWHDIKCSIEKRYYCEETKCHPGTGRCFWWGTPTTTWEAARKNCQSDDGDLAVMETEELWDFVTSQLNIDVFSWIGLTDSAQESVFRWLNGAPLYYDKWHPNEPDATIAQNGVVVLNSALYDAGLVGSDERLTLCSTIAPACLEAKDGCISVNETPNTTIGPLRELATYAVAKETCEAEGKQLLSIRDLDKEHLVELLQPGASVWLDLTDSEVETVFRWSDGFITTWVNWFVADPNGKRAENCVARDANSRWRDVACTQKYNFFCEKEERRCHQATGRCYWWGKSSVTWNEARESCQSESGDLAVMETRELWDFVCRALQTQGKYAWVGMDSSQGGAGVYRWLNGAALYYDAWSRTDGHKEPNAPGDEMCNMIHNEKLSDNSCSVTSPFRTLCSTQPATCTNVKDGCIAEEGTDKTSHLSELHPATNYEEAMSICHGRGQQLLMIKDKDKEDQVKQHHQEQNNIWIGLTDSEVERVFRWSDGYLATWVNWNLAEPSEYTTENCVARRTDGKWSDVKCEGSRPFYCEMYDPEPIDQTLYTSKDGVLASNHVVSTKKVASLSECVRLCLRQHVCQAFSLADDLTCAVALTNHEAAFSEGPGVVFVKAA